MASTIHTPGGTHPSSWTDFYVRNSDDSGPFQTLFETTTVSLARMTEDHLNDVNKFTETIAGSDFGNMLLVPGRKGVMQIIHHGFACNTPDGFALAFAHGNLGDCTAFKTLDRSEVVAPARGPGDAGIGGEVTTVPSLASMLEAESPEKFGALDAEDNHILENHPNHVLINPSVFLEVNGAKLVASKNLAYALVEAFQLATEDDDELSVAREAEAASLGTTLAMLWASEKGLLKEVRLEDVPDNTMMNHIVRSVRAKISGNAFSNAVDPTRLTETVGGGNASMEMMAASSQSMVALLNRFQEGSESDRIRKESEKSILKTMGPTQRGLFTSLCTRRMTTEPVMSEFMKNLTTSTTPQKAINLIQSETRDWEGTFSVGGFHRMLSNGFLSQEANRANPGGFTIFMFHPKTVDLGAKSGKGGNELLREYLGMDVAEETLDFYMKQGFYTPTNPNDLRIQLQTTLDMLELLTCDDTIAGKGLAYILHPSRWARMTTVLNDRFKSEKDFGAKFCYALDRHLQTFLNKMTRWEDLAVDGQPRYLTLKAEELIERLEDGQGLNVILPVALSSHTGAASDSNKRGGTSTTEKPGKKKKSTAADDRDASPDPASSHTNSGTVPEWKLPPGVEYMDLFNAKMPGLKGWPVLLDTRISKKLNRAQKAPMCVRFQAVGKCRHGCSLSHITASDMPDGARTRAAALFKAVYSS